MSEPPRPVPPAAKSGQSNAGTFIALFGLILMGGSLVGLTALVLPQFLGLVLVVGGLFVVPALFHYLVWGWWLSQIKDENPDDD
ncbi:MAG TPA: hypothetical protein VL475_00685 [Planctomycetaceae bacterium]|jgi:hypothetical protein|nr:hypothetical protein [Planctomycetaceae bacterium]